MKGYLASVIRLLHSTIDPKLKERLDEVSPLMEIFKANKELNFDPSNMFIRTEGKVEKALEEEIKSILITQNSFRDLEVIEDYYEKNKKKLTDEFLFCYKSYDGTYSEDSAINDAFKERRHQSLENTIKTHCEKLGRFIWEGVYPDDMNYYSIEFPDHSDTLFYLRYVNSSTLELITSTDDLSDLGILSIVDKNKFPIRLNGDLIETLITHSYSEHNLDRSTTLSTLSLFKMMLKGKIKDLKKIKNPLYSLTEAKKLKDPANIIDKRKKIAFKVTLDNYFEFLESLEGDINNLLLRDLQNNTYVK